MSRLKKYWLIFNLVLFTTSIYAQKSTSNSLQSQPIYTSLQEALKNPTEVYRLKLKLSRKCDSIPEDLFLLTNLQELRLTGCHLKVVNQKIGELQNLRFLYLNRNHLVRLPESLSQLTNLIWLDISRNPLIELPANIGNMISLEVIDAWDTQIFILPESISKLANTLKTIDLRQVPLTDSEHSTMQRQLPTTSIPYSHYCDCNSDR